MSATKASRLSRGDVGAWVFKGNPDKVWDYFGERDDTGRQPGDVDPNGGWTLGRTYRNALIEPGDLFVLWITGSVEPGIHEIGTVTGEVTLTTFEDDYLIDETRRGRPVDWVETRPVLLRNPVRLDQMKADPTISRCEQIRAPRGSNPSYLSPEELAALVPLIQTSYLRKAGWTATRLKKAGIN